MSKIRLHGTSSGYTDIAPTAAAGNNTLTAPTGTGTLVAQDAAGAIGITSVLSTTSRTTTGIVTAFTATNATFAGDIDPIANAVYDIGASNLKFKQLFVNNIDASAGIVTASAFIPSTGQLGHRNLVINGAMQVAQRGTVSSVLNSSYGGPDRFQAYRADGPGVWQISQQASAPSGSGFSHCLEHKVSTANGTLDSADEAVISYTIEGKDLAQVKKGTSSAEQLTLSFWCRTGTSGTYIAELYDLDNSRQVSKSFTHAGSDGWEKKEITFPADTTGAFTYDNSGGLQIRIWIAAGTTWTSGTLNTTWAAASNANRAVGCTNLSATLNNYFRMTGVQLEIGAVATPFEHRSYGEELARCQRYYYLHGPNDNSITYSIVGTGMIGQNGSTTTAKVLVYLPVAMRTKPSVSVDSGSNQFKNDAGGTTADSTFGAIWSDASHSQAVWCDFAGGSSSNGTATMVYKRGSGGGILGFSAEF